MASTKKPTFESSMQELEEILQKMSSNSLTLDENITLYEKAAKLIRVCHDSLQQAQLRIDEIGSINDILEN